MFFFLCAAVLAVPVGIVTVYYFFLRFLWFLLSNVRAYVLARPLGLRTDIKAMGQWAVVTGASRGIGKGYAKELARRGLDVVLLSRKKDELEKVQKEIEKESPNAKVKVVVADLADGAVFDSLEKELASLDIAVLINNAGIGPEHPCEFLDCPWPTATQYCDKLIAVNVRSLTRLMQCVLPKMVEKKKGAIVNIASVMGACPFPRAATYAASKAYVSSLTNAVRAEVSGTGVIVQCITPCVVATDMAAAVAGKLPAIAVAQADEFAASAVDTIGLLNETGGSLSHAIQCTMINSQIVEWGFPKLCDYLSKSKTN